MKETIELIKHLGKGEVKTQIKRTRNAIIYTRVSSREQALTNASLETQKKYCLEYALKHNLNVLAFYGGTYESAQTDERKEFDRMLKFANSCKEGVSYIVVYSLERFSRSGGNAIFLTSELKKKGISIVSVTQPIDSDTSSGKLQQSIHFIFSNYDNDLRREKCVTGMKEKLLRGEWIGGAPTGYQFTHNKNKQLEFSKDAELVRVAFRLKTEKLTNTEISEEVKKMGLKVSVKLLTDMLRNPFYCGFMAHKFLEGQIIKGKHEPLISEELFLKANNIMSETTRGFKHVPKNENAPLKNLLTCGKCGTRITSYIVKKKNLYYYKCQGIGCGNNKSVKSMHLLFEEFLESKYQIRKPFFVPLKAELLETYQNLTSVEQQAVSSIKQTLSEVNNKVEKIEERHAFGEIERELYQRTASKLIQQREDLENQLKYSQNELSNPSSYVVKALQMCLNLRNLWVSAHYEGKRKLVEIMFPDGLTYFRKNDEYRTSRENVILQLIISLTVSYDNKKRGTSKSFVRNSAGVEPQGIEFNLNYFENQVIKSFEHFQYTGFPLLQIIHIITIRMTKIINW